LARLAAGTQRSFLILENAIKPLEAAICAQSARQRKTLSELIGVSLKN
jgi:hypothetical protein